MLKEKAPDWARCRGQAALEGNVVAMSAPGRFYTAWVIFSRRAPSLVTAAYLQIAVVHGGC
jgi:hypothetical protein